MNRLTLFVVGAILGSLSAAANPALAGSTPGPWMLAKTQSVAAFRNTAGFEIVAESNGHICYQTQIEQIPGSVDHPTGPPTYAVEERVPAGAVCHVDGKRTIKKQVTISPVPTHIFVRSADYASPKPPQTVPVVVEDAR